MIKPTMRICTFLLAAGLMIATAGMKAQSVIPIPLRMEQGSGTFQFSGETLLYTNLKGKEKKMMMDYLETLPIHFKSSKKQAKENVVSLLITKDNSQLPSPESYTLEVTPRKITVQATSEPDYSMAYRPFCKWHSLQWEILGQFRLRRFKIHHDLNTGG